LQSDDRSVPFRVRVGRGVPVTEHDRNEDAGAVLTEMLAETDSMLTLGTTVDDFMRGFEL